jgi:hypothetical protein
MNQLAPIIGDRTPCPLYVANVRQLIILPDGEKSVSLRCPFGDRARPTDSAPLFKAPAVAVPERTGKSWKATSAQAHAAIFTATSRA